MYRLLRWYCNSEKIRQSLVEIQSNRNPVSFPNVLIHTANEAEELCKLLDNIYKSKEAVSKFPLDKIDDFTLELYDFFPTSAIPPIVKFFGRYKQISKFLKETYPKIRNNIDKFNTAELIDIASGISKSIAAADKKFFSEIYRRIKNEITDQDSHNLNLILQAYARIDFKSPELYHSIEKTITDKFHEANDSCIYQSFKVLAELGYVSSELARKVEKKIRDEMKDRSPVFLQYILDGYVPLRFKDYETLNMIHSEMSKNINRFDHDTAIALMNSYVNFEDIPENNKAVMLMRIITIRKIETLRDFSLVYILNISHKLNNIKVVYPMYEDEILKRLPRYSLYFLPSICEALSNAGIKSTKIWTKIEELSLGGLNRLSCEVIARMLTSFDKVGYPDYIYGVFTDRITSFRYIDAREYVRLMDIYLKHPELRWKEFLFNTFKKVVHVINPQLARNHLEAFRGMKEADLRKLEAILNSKVPKY
jgi:hypothetical protein